MPESKHTNIPDVEPLKPDSPIPYKTNRRKSTRYSRSDIGVTVRKIRMLNLSFLKNEDIPVKLLDISSRGVSVQAKSNLNLDINNKVALVIRFADFKEFKIPSIVIRKTSGETPIYGIKFEKIHNKLANYLLKTQTRLRFK